MRDLTGSLHRVLLQGQFFAVCQENYSRLKLQKCEFMQETMQHLAFDVGYGWWTPAASKAKPLLDAKVRHEDPKKGLHDVRSFIGVCNFYRRHIKNFTYTCAILMDLIKKSTTWRWGPQEQQAFDKLEDKVANAKCLGVRRVQGLDYPSDRLQQCGRWWNVVPMASTREGGVRLGYFTSGDRRSEPRWNSQAQLP